jgi:hypothetical protein
LDEREGGWGIGLGRGYGGPVRHLLSRTYHDRQNHDLSIIDPSFDGASQVTIWICKGREEARDVCDRGDRKKSRAREKESPAGRKKWGEGDPVFIGRRREGKMRAGARRGGERV